MTQPLLNRSLLLIAYKFPPMHSISCNRTRALYLGMQKYFDTVCVISTTNRHKLQQDDSDPISGNITDAWTFDYRTMFQGRHKAATAGEGYKTSALGKFLRRLQHSFPTLYVFGEGNAVYIRNGFRAARRILEQKHITHIFSTFPPYADHLIAYRLKKHFPNLTWIADFRDLHVDPAQDNLFAKHFQYNQNRKILAHADIVTTVSEGLAEHLRALHPNVQVLRNGIPGSAIGRTGRQYQQFTIAYTGSMFQDKRKPDALLSAIRNLIDTGKLDQNRIAIRHAGKDSAVWHPLIEKYKLEGIFIDHGLVSKQDADQIQHNSHINLLLSYSTPGLKGNLTGKFADYLRAGRQILFLINGPQDTEIEQIMHETQAGRVFYADQTDTIQAWILQQYNLWRDTGDLQNAATAETLRAYTWSSILQLFAERNALGTMQPLNS